MQIKQQQNMKYLNELNWLYWMSFLVRCKTFIKNEWKQEKNNMKNANRLHTMLHRADVSFSIFCFFNSFLSTRKLNVQKMSDIKSIILIIFQFKCCLLTAYNVSNWTFGAQKYTYLLLICLKCFSREKGIHRQKLKKRNLCFACKKY